MLGAALNKTSKDSLMKFSLEKNQIANKIKVK
jgi:hypothetical protein